MGYTIVSGNEPSPEALHQNHATLFYYQNTLTNASFILNLQIPKIKWDVADESTINNFYKIDNRLF